jgi:predicted dehydrogenase/threonine dehydrogenase-like Zn-dependent dehydrogenase
MKQVLQSLKTGATEVADVPCPAAAAGQVLIRTSKTLVSAGTERMLVEFGKAGWISKARQQPDKVRMVIDKIRTDGLLPTMDAVFGKLDQPLPLGYCNVGTAVQVGRGVSGFAAGDRVASNGKHAEMVAVPENLCAKVPDGVSDEEAAFTVLGAIALQGIRLVQPTLGETVVVTGLGLIGLVTVQLLRAHGCRVIGLDFDPARLAMARQFGAQTVDLGAGADPVAAAAAYTRGRGVDAVIITASSSSNEPVHQAALMCRKRGRIVLVGVTGLELSRADFFEKELTFQVSCSYGPGRYDPSYEEKGNDYPVGFVRWTEQRNFEAVLDMMADGRIDVKPLISHRFAIDQVEEAYGLVAGSGPSLGILLDYPHRPEATVRTIAIASDAARAPAGNAPAVSFIGSGAYATAILVPAFKAAGARLETVSSSGGVSGVHVARKFGFAHATTSTDEVMASAESGAVIISTRHNSHASLVLQALAHGRDVFVEKPLCLTEEELDAIIAAYETSDARVMVGFNRRFAPNTVQLKSLLAATTGPKSFVMTVNAGAIPANHWTQDPSVGGGRIVGEACHFIDLIRFLAASPIVRHEVIAMEAATVDTVTISLGFADGSIGAIHYFANGNKSFPKERLEVFAAGGILQLDNFRQLTGHGWPRFKRQRLLRQDKGQKACATAFVDALRTGGASPIPFDELVEVQRATLAITRNMANASQG